MSLSSCALDDLDWEQVTVGISYNYVTAANAACFLLQIIDKSISFFQFKQLPIHLLKIPYINKYRYVPIVFNSMNADLFLCVQ